MPNCLVFSQLLQVGSVSLCYMDNVFVLYRFCYINNVGSPGTSTALWRLRLSHGTTMLSAQMCILFKRSARYGVLMCVTLSPQPMCRLKLYSVNCCGLRYNG